MPSRLQRIRRGVILGLSIILLILILIVLGLCYQEVHHWLYPPRRPVQSQPANSPLTEVTFQTDDDLTIYGWYAPPRTGYAILMLHGFSGNRDQLLHHADYLIEAGYGVLTIDFRNHGDSDGDRTSMGYYEIRDARVAYDFLRAQDEVEHVVLWGHSMGGAIASRLMEEVDADGLVVVATFTDFPTIVRQGVIARGYPETPITEILTTMYGTLSGADWNGIRPIDHLAEVDKPILWIHGTNDTTVPVDHAYRMSETNPKIKVIIFEGGTHNNLFEIAPEKYQTEVMHYLDQLMPVSATS